MAIPLLFLVSALTFVLVSAEPGSVVQKILPSVGTQREYRALSHQLGLDRPVYTQYWDWLTHAVRGNLGTSWVTHESVTSMLSSGLPVTLSLVLGAVIMFVVVGVGIGMLSAIRGGIIGRIGDGVALVGYSIPGFWLGALLISAFALAVRLFPATGYVQFAQSPLQWARSLVLPVVALTIGSVAVIARQTRESMVDVLASEHIRMAWANGIPRRDIYFRLALKNAGSVIVTVAGLQLVALLLGTVFVEQVFALPGLGSTLVTATIDGDIPVVLGITMLFTLIIVVVNLVVDLLYRALDPRVRTA